MGEAIHYKKCPFCKSINIDRWGCSTECQTCGAMGPSRERCGASWNTRPGEDAKDKRIAKLEAALREIIDPEMRYYNTSVHMVTIATEALDEEGK